MVRFFTVYGPWGRPDMALFKFTKAIINDEKIDVYNYGKMKRDFTYIDDLISGIEALIDVVPERTSENSFVIKKNDSLSPVANFRVVNIGNSSPTSLDTFIKAIEASLGKKAQKNFLPIQPGDVPETTADSRLLEQLTGSKPSTDIKLGVENFISWYLEFYKIKL